MGRLTLTSASPAETEELGRRLGAILEKGSFIALIGELGGGKTCLTRGIVAGAAPQSSHLVASPTYAIMNEYPGPPPDLSLRFLPPGLRPRDRGIGL